MTNNVMNRPDLKQALAGADTGVEQAYCVYSPYEPTYCTRPTYPYYYGPPPGGYYVPEPRYYAPPLRPHHPPHYHHPQPPRPPHPQPQHRRHGALEQQDVPALVSGPSGMNQVVEALQEAGVAPAAMAAPSAVVAGVGQVREPDGVKIS